MKKLLALAALLLVAACEEAPPSANFGPITVPGQAYRLNVAEVRVENNTPAQPNDVSAQFPVPPGDAVTQWAHDHLVAAGGAGYAIVSINDASVREVKLEKTKGMKGFFTDDQDARYDGHIDVTVRIYNSGNLISDAEVSATSALSRSIHEKATLAEREQFQYDLTRDLLTQFNSQISPRIGQYFAGYLR